MRVFYSLLAILMLASCAREENNTPDDSNLLIGTWRDTMVGHPQGYYVEELVFNPDSVFTSKSSAYGVYAGQNSNDLSSWFEYEGDYSPFPDSLFFISHQLTSWDSFFGGQPVTKVKDKILFKDCTYAIRQDTLELNYITYPADHPENTQKLYIKVK